MKIQLYGSNAAPLDAEFQQPDDPDFQPVITGTPERIRIAPELDLVALTFGRTGLWRLSGALRSYKHQDFQFADLDLVGRRIVAVGTHEGHDWLGFVDPTTLRRSDTVSLQRHRDCRLAGVLVSPHGDTCVVLWRGQTAWGFDVHRLPSLKRVEDRTVSSGRADSSVEAISPDGRWLVTTFAAREAFWLDDASRDDSLTAPSGGGSFVMGYLGFYPLRDGASRVLTVRAKVPAGFRPDDADEYLMHRPWGPLQADDEHFWIRLPGGRFEKVRYDVDSDLTFDLDSPNDTAGPVRRTVDTAETVIEAPKLATGSTPKQLDALLLKLVADFPASLAANPLRCLPQAVVLYGAACDALGLGRIDDSRTLLHAHLEANSAIFFVAGREAPVSMVVSGNRVTAPGRPVKPIELLVSAWLDSFHLALALRRRDILDALASFRIEWFERRAFPQPQLEHVALARAFLLGDQDWTNAAARAQAVYEEASRKELAALRLGANWHALKALTAVLLGDQARFDAELIEVLEANRRHRSKEDPTNPSNRLCRPALGLAALGLDRGWPIRVASEYMPRALYAS